MEERIVMASRFKEHCLALIDQVARTKIPVTVTKRGRPLARLVPIAEEPRGRSTDRSVTLLAEADEAYFSSDESWKAEAAREDR